MLGAEPAVQGEAAALTHRLGFVRSPAGLRGALPAPQSCRHNEITVPAALPTPGMSRSVPMATPGMLRGEL